MKNRRSDIDLSPKRIDGSSFFTRNVDDERHLLKLHMIDDGVFHTKEFEGTRFILFGDSIMITVKNKYCVIVESLLLEIPNEILDRFVFISYGRHIAIDYPFTRIRFFYELILFIEKKRKVIREHEEPGVKRLRKIFYIIHGLLKEWNIFDAVIHGIVIRYFILRFGKESVITQCLVHLVPIPESFIVPVEYSGVVILLFIQKVRKGPVCIFRSLHEGRPAGKGI